MCWGGEGISQVKKAGLENNGEKECVRIESWAMCGEEREDTADRQIQKERERKKD